MYGTKQKMLPQIRHSNMYGSTCSIYSLKNTLSLPIHNIYRESYVINY